MDKQCWVIVGATSAVALRFAHVVASFGHQVILLGRDREKLLAIQTDLKIRYASAVDVLFFDACELSAHVAVAEAAVALAQYPISLYVAVGLMIPGVALQHTWQDAVTTLNANLTGVVSITYAFLPYFTREKKGELIFLGSVAGERGRINNFDYGAAKAGLATFCEGLRGALLPLGVSVTLMKLGYIDTPMTYGKSGLIPSATPDDCAAACLLAGKKKKAVVYYPSFWRYIIFVFKRIPLFLLYRVKV